MRDSNPRRQCQLIYSQPPLAARETCQECVKHLSNTNGSFAKLKIRTQVPHSPTYAEVASGCSSNVPFLRTRL